MNPCQDIINEIIRKETDVRNHFKISDSQWNDKINKIPLANCENLPEDYWTFLIGCAYAINGNQGCHSLQQIFCEDRFPPYSEEVKYEIWFQASPLKGNSSPKFDLAFGNLKRPKNKKQQIIFDPPQNNNSSLVGFVEFKTLEDINSKSKDNPKYNQLAKYIRTALIIQKAGVFPKIVHLTLVTPDEFIANHRSRFYGYKFREYACPDINRENIDADIQFPIINEELPNDWINHDQECLERLSNLDLHWISYEKILDKIPESDIKSYVDDIREKNCFFIKQENEQDDDS